MTDYKANTYDDADMRDIITEIEGLDDEAEKIMAAARGKVGGLRRKQKAAKKRAKDDLAIPMGVLVPLLKQRALERKLQKLVGDVSEDLIEVFEDAAGQFSLFAPEADEPKQEPVAQRAARRAAKKAKANQEAEIEEGAKVLDELAAVH